MLLSDLDELYASCPKQVISVVAAIFAHCFETLLLPALERAQPTEKFESVLRGALGGAVVCILLLVWFCADERVQTGSCQGRLW